MFVQCTPWDTLFQKLNLSLDGFQDLTPPHPQKPLKICFYLIPTQKDTTDWKKNWALSKRTRMGEELSELFLFTFLVF